MALAADEAQYGYGNNKSVEDAMKVLGRAGYNSDNWVCLTAGYQVYWYEIDNRCILYNSKTAKVEYPEEYIDKKIYIDINSGEYKGTVDATGLVGIYIMNSSFVHPYNENQAKAQEFDMDLYAGLVDSNTGKIKSGLKGTASSKVGDITTYNVTSTVSIGGQKISDNAANYNSGTNLSYLASSENTQAIIKSNLGATTGQVLYLNATKEDVSAASKTSDNRDQAYASLQICAFSVGDAEVPPTIKDSADVKENVFYLTIVGTPQTEGYAAAQKAAGDYIYKIFTQITNNTVDSDVTIILGKDIVLDCSRNEWCPAKTYSGYFGCPDGIVTISGVRLTSSSSVSQMVGFDGDTSTYKMTGFIGSVYGTATIENLMFSNLVIDEPGYDYVLTTGHTNNRMTVGLIGTVTTRGGALMNRAETPNVTISNVTIDSTCTIKGSASAGGLIGYVGAYKPDCKKVEFGSGVNLKINNCSVNAKIISTNDTKNTDYHPVGGLIGFMARCAKTDAKDNNYFTVEISGCSVGATFEGYNAEGSAIGNVITGEVIFSKYTDENVSNKVNSFNSAFDTSAWATSDIIGVIKNQGQNANFNANGTSNTFVHMQSEAITVANSDSFFVGTYDTHATKTLSDLKVD